jgi:hypothetical protein
MTATSSIADRVHEALQAHELGKKLALSDPEYASQLVSSELAAIDPAIEMTSFGERTRGPVHELVVEWREPVAGSDHEEIIALPVRT